MKKRIGLIILLFIVVVSFAVLDALNRHHEVEAQKIYIDGTRTLRAFDLWLAKDEARVTNLKQNSDGHLILEDSSLDATYVSLPMGVTNFEEMVLSWNLKNISDARVTFFVALGDGSEFGDYQIMGLFKDEHHMSFNQSNDAYGSVFIDTLINNDPDNYDHIKIRFTITPGNAENLRLENISVTTKKAGSTLKFDETILKNKYIDVAPLQQLSIPTIGNLICSPTSVAMVLNHYGYSFTQQEMAKKVYDTGRGIYGNWTFNASYAGSLDNISARVEYVDDFKAVVDYILNDVPVVFSITTTSTEQLSGSIMAFPAGHLIVLKGFEKIDGIWHGVFNDPAEYEDDKVERKYPLEQVMQVWRQYTYVITNNNIF